MSIHARNAKRHQRRRQEKIKAFETLQHIAVAEHLQDQGLIRLEGTLADGRKITTTLAELEVIENRYNQRDLAKQALYQAWMAQP